MTMTLPDLFFIYPTVLLAVIFSAWFFSVWKRRRWELTGRRIFICGYCGARMTEERPMLKIRCPACGAQQECQSLKLEE